MTNFRTAVLAATCLLASPAAAQTIPSAATDPTSQTLPPPPSDGPAGGPSDWIVDVGIGAFYAPAFLGSDDQQLFAGPIVSVRYKDRVFASAGGIGADLIKSGALRAGPIVKFQMQRRESNSSPLRIAGKASDALRGLGDVGFTPEVGGYAEYRWHMLAAKAELRKGLGGHDGVIGDLSLRAMLPLTVPPPARPPMMFSLGTRASFVDATYNNAYFGVTAAQSAGSGLRRYDAGGGLLSYGANAALIVPLSLRLNASLLGGYDRLAGDAGRSPLVEDRGSRDQLSLGLGLTYRFEH